VYRMLVAVLVGVVGLMAASPVGTITSAESFVLNGAAVPVAGVPQWPVATGDEVAMARSCGLLVFKDGSRIFLIPNTRIKVEANGRRTVVRLLDGGLAYKMGEKAVVDLAALEEKALPEGSAEGRLWVENKAALWSPDNPAFYAAASAKQASNQREQHFFGRYQMRPFQLGFVNDWRQYNPPFGNPALQPPQPTGPVPPGPVLQPPDQPPISAHRP